MTTISVVVPVRDGARYLREALDSILGQVPAPQEVVVVDDGSSDASAAVAAACGPPVKVVRTPPRGAGAARNAGLAVCTGEVIAFLDADDRWCPGSLACRLAALQARPGRDLVLGRVVEFAASPLPAGLVVRTEPMPGGVAGALLVRRSAFDRVGPLRTDLGVGEFVDWMARADEAGLVRHHVGDVVLERRVHGDNLSRRASRGDLVRVVKDALDRRRAAGGDR